MKKKSFIWNHMTVTSEGTRATCHHCQKEFAFTLNAMSNLKRHIKVKHPEVFAVEEIDDTTTEAYKVEEVVQVNTEQELKTFEISMKGFEEMEDMEQSAPDDPQYPDFTPEAERAWKPVQPVLIASSSSQKKDRKRSAMWDHFQQSSCKTSATCLHCGRVIRMGTISNLARHLRYKHPNKSVVQTHEYASRLKPSCTTDTVAEDHLLRNELEINSEVVEINVDSFQHPENVIEIKVNESQNEHVIEGNVTQSSQTETLNTMEDFDMYDYIKPKERTVAAERADHQLVKMIVKGCHPVSIVEQEGFKEFISLLNPKYELPSLNKLTRELIPECYRECEAKASKSLREAETVCLYIDQWKSKTTVYMCITAHFINKECKYEPLFLACHTVNIDENATDVSQRLLETVSEWEISDKVVAVITDNTEVITEAVKILNWVHIPHFIRSLCVIVHNSLQSIKAVISKLKNITEELKKSPSVIAEIYSQQKALGFRPVKFITKVKNDSNSSFTTLEMITRFTKLRSALIHVLIQLPEFKLSDYEWRVLKSVVDDVLFIFKEVKEEVAKEERVCMSKIVFYIKSLKCEMNRIQNMNTLPSDAICVATVSDTMIDKHFKDFLGSDLVSFMLLLDPRLKKYAFNDESEYASACSKLKREVCEVTVPELEYNEPDSKSLWFKFDREVQKLNGVKDPIGKGILEFENYLQEELLGRDQDPLVWWDQRKAIYPRLFKLMKRYLCISTKSTPRESISFKTAYMLSQLKNSNSTSSESELMFLHHNM